MTAKKPTSDLRRRPARFMFIEGVLAATTPRRSWRFTCPGCHKRIEGTVEALRQHYRLCVTPRRGE